jgi:hypothetical protein
MLHASISKIAEDARYPQLNTILDTLSKNPNAFIPFGSSDKRRAKTILKDRPVTDSGQEGCVLLSFLLLEDSLRTFQQMKSQTPSSNPFYAQRAEIHIIFENYREAISLARKGHLPDFEFVALVGAGQFEKAAGLSFDLLRIIPSSHSDRKSIVSIFELLHLLLFVSFATSTSEQTKTLWEAVLRATTYELDWLTGLADCFVKREFTGFVNKLGELLERLEMSIHTAKISKEFLEAIRVNLVRNVVRPLAKVAFGVIASELLMTVEEVGDALRILVREGKVTGKMNFREKLLIRVGLDSEPREMDDMLARVMAVRQGFEAARWKLSYFSGNENRG